MAILPQNGGTGRMFGTRKKQHLKECKKTFGVLTHATKQKAEQ